MTSEQKNRFIVEEVLQKCWHDWQHGRHYACCGIQRCTKCNLESDPDTQEKYDNPDFYSTSPDEQTINFFRLLNGLPTKVRSWLSPLIVDCLNNDNPASTLADAVVEYRKGEKDAE